MFFIPSLSLYHAFKSSIVTLLQCLFTYRLMMQNGCGFVASIKEASLNDSQIASSSFKLKMSHCTLDTVPFLYVGVVSHEFIVCFEVWQ